MNTAISLRPPAEVMRLRRLGSFHQCRLSFMRVLLRRFVRDGWTFERKALDVNDKGVGHAVYTAKGPERAYSLVAFAHDLPDELRSVIRACAAAVRTADRRIQDQIRDYFGECVESV